MGEKKRASVRPVGCVLPPPPPPGGKLQNTQTFIYLCRINFNSVTTFCSSSRPSHPQWSKRPTGWRYRTILRSPAPALTPSSASVTHLPTYRTLKVSERSRDVKLLLPLQPFNIHLFEVFSRCWDFGLLAKINNSKRDHLNSNAAY